MAIVVQHINANLEDVMGNNGVGRYFFLSGSDGRAQQIAAFFENREDKLHPRHHNLYMGQIRHPNGNMIDVASIATGMGGPSADIIINELAMLGAKRMLRVGTAGSLHPEHVKIGDLVVATGAVRDDKASWDYIYPEYPAMASLDYVISSKNASVGLFSDRNVHFGVVHSKSSLFAREYQFSLLPDSMAYMDTIRRAGVLATEMECAQFFTLAPILSARYGSVFSSKDQILCGAVLAIIGDESGFAKDKNLIVRANECSIQLALETVFRLFESDLQ